LGGSGTLASLVIVAVSLSPLQVWYCWDDGEHMLFAISTVPGSLPVRTLRTVAPLDPVSTRGLPARHLFEFAVKNLFSLSRCHCSVVIAVGFIAAFSHLLPVSQLNDIMPASFESDGNTHGAFIASISSKISEGSPITDEDLIAVNQLFRSGGSSQLPFLDRAFLKTLSDGTVVVRHLGMVQDMLEPEYYVSQIDDRSFHFRDVQPSHISDNDNFVEDFTNLAERSPLFVVPMPFTTEWFNQRSAAEQPSTPSNPKTTDVETFQAENKSRKREREIEKEKKSKPRMYENKNPNLMDTTEATKESISATAPVDWWPAGCNGSAPSQCPILAKFYYDQGSNEKREKLRLNDVVETIGILSINPWEADFSSPEDEMLLGALPPPPPSQLPRLHVLAYRTVDLDDLAHETVVNEHQEEEEVSHGDDLTSLLENSLATQALFLSLLSKAERKGSSMQRTSSSAVGCVSLNICTTLDSTCKILYEQLQSILQATCPVVATFDLTGNKKQHPFPSKMNGRIMPKCWQLPRGSTILIRLGNANHEHLEELLTSNQISYTFEGGLQIPFEGDYRIIVISNNNKNVKCALHVNCDTDMSELKHELPLLRHSLSLSRKTRNVKLAGQVLEQAQEDFLAQRSTARSDHQLRMPQEEDFHRWLSMTRLQARSRQSETATVEDWWRAFALDNAIMSSKK
jgi:hypothetical protein